MEKREWPPPLTEAELMMKLFDMDSIFATRLKAMKDMTVETFNQPLGKILGGQVHVRIIFDGRR